MGNLVDRVGGRRLLLVLHVLLVSGLILIAMAPTFAWLLPGFILSGIALAASNPATDSLVRRHIQVRRRGLVMGIKQAGVPLAGLVAGAALPPLSGVLGWRVALLCAAVIGVAGIVGTLLYIPPVAPRDRPRDAPASPVRNPDVSFLAVYAFFMASGVATVSVYLPLYAYEKVGMGVAAAGTAVAGLNAVGMLGRILWGRQTDRSGSYQMPLIVMAMLSVPAIAMIWLAQTAGPWLLLLGAAFYGATALPWNAVAMAAIVQRSGPASGGRDTGRVMVGFYGGFVIAPAALGYSIDATGGSYRFAWAAVLGLLLAALVVSLAWAVWARPT